jgi:hypothetical protein
MKAGNIDGRTIQVAGEPRGVKDCESFTKISEGNFVGIGIIVGA